MKTLFKVNLCKCNNCDLVLVDQNPQIGAEIYPVFEDKNRQWIDINGKEVADMQYEDGAWVCPVCEVDDYLTDI